MDYTYAARFEARADQLEGVLDDVSRAMREMADNVERQTEESRSAFERMSQGMGVSLGVVTAGAGALVTALGVAGVAGALRELMGQANEANDALNKAADRAGITAERMSTLAFAAKGVDAELEDLQDALIEVQAKSVLDPGKFEALGISLEGVADGSATSADLLERVSDAMAKAGTSARAAAIADETLGGAGRKLLPILKDGSAALREQEQAARDAAAEVSTLAARSAGELASAQQRAAARTQALGSALGEQLNPLLAVATDEMGRVAQNAAAWLRANEALVQGKIQEWLAWLADAGIPAVAQGLVVTTRAWTVMGTAMAQLSQLGAALFQRLAEGLSGFLTLAARAAEALGQGGLAGELRGAAQVHSDVAAGFAGDVQAYEAEISKAWDSQDKLEEQIGEMGVKASESVRAVAASVAKLRLELAAGAGQAAEAPGAPAVDKEALAARREALAAELEAFRQSTLSEEEALRESHMARRAMIAESAQLRLITRAEADAMELQAAQQFATAMLEIHKRQEDEAQALRDAALEATRAQVEEMTTYFEGLFTELGAGIQAAVSGMVDGTMTTREAFKEMGKVFLRVIGQQLQAVAQAALQEQVIGSATATARITQNAAVAASGAAASQSGIPIAGPGLALAAAAAMLPAVLALIDTFNTGGIVGGRVGGSGANRDSVLIGATTGEAVIDRETTARLAGIFGGAAPAPAGPSERSNKGQGGTTIVLQPFALPESRIEAERSARLLVEAQSRL